MSFSSFTEHCPACASLIDGVFNYCPFCGHSIRLACTSCHTPLQESWRWCPTCGHRVMTQTLSIPTQILPGADAAPAHPSNPQAEEYNQRGVELYETERYDDAVEQFERALDLDPTNSLYHCNLAVALGERGDHARAFEEYQRALSLNPRDLTALLNLGIAYNLHGDVEHAQQQWLRVVELAPDSVEAEEARDNLRALDETE